MSAEAEDTPRERRRSGADDGSDAATKRTAGRNRGRRRGQQRRSGSGRRPSSRTPGTAEQQDADKPRRRTDEGSAADSRDGASAKQRSGGTRGSGGSRSKPARARSGRGKSRPQAERGKARPQGERTKQRSHGDSGKQRSQADRDQRSRADRSGAKGRNKRGGRRRRGPSSRHERAAFWGDPARLPEPGTDVRMTDQPAAVPTSLGPPPLPGHERIAQHYFGAVYERAVNTAGALAAAGGLIDPAALVDDTST